MLDTEKIHIFYACDDNFVKFTMVSFFSMKKNASRDKKYHVHVLHTTIKPETQERMLKMADECFEISFDSVKEYLDGICERLPIRDYYSNTTYYRMFIADMYPELERAIYIDSDTVVTGDISELYAYDISNYDIAACREQVMVQEDVYGTYVEKCLGIDRNGYFNAGILFINCNRFREKKVLEDFVRLLGIYNFRVTQDEDYLNVICRDHVLWIPQTWNTEMFGELLYPIEEANIIHYIMVSKPWHYENCRHGDIFWKYAEQTEVYGEIRAILDAYTDADRARDAESAVKLAELARSEIEREDNYMARISEERASDRVKILEKIAQFEREGRFDEDVEDDPPGREIQPGEVDYLGEKLSSRIQSKFAFSMARRYLNNIIENGQLIVKDIIGIENFANLDSGAIITCNHFNAFDSIAIQLAYEYSGHKNRKFYRIIREGNYTSFPGFFGYLMRHCNTLPLSSNPSAMKEFTRATDTLLKAGNFVLIYPEQSMWWNYRKPKPLKPGGFYLAAKNKLPVLPCFITMKDTKLIGDDGFPIQEYTIHVSPPIYPEEGVRTGINAQRMADENFRIWKEIYEREYGIPLRYDEGDIDADSDTDEAQNA